MESPKKKFSLRYIPKENRFVLFFVLIFGLAFSLLSPIIFGLTNSAMGIILVFGFVSLFCWFIPSKLCNEVEIAFGPEGLDVSLLKRGWLAREIFHGHQDYHNISVIRHWDYSTHKGGFSILMLIFSDGVKLDFQSNSIINIFYGIKFKMIADHLVTRMRAKNIPVKLEGEIESDNGNRVKVTLILLFMLICILPYAAIWLLNSQSDNLDTLNWLLSITGTVVAELLLIISFIRKFYRYNTKPTL